MAITFAVDNVKPTRRRLDTLPIERAMQDALGVDLLHVSHDATLVDEGRRLHPLLAAVHLAFSEHRPLSLSPDHVWLTMEQGFARHVDANAEALRERFVRHQGRAEIHADLPEIPQTPEAWGDLVTRLGKEIERHVGPGIHRLLVCAFSTTTERERLASEVVMMSGFRRYFDYHGGCICGIPEITLEGTPEDWAEIRRRLDVLAEYDLAWWADALRPVLDQLVSTAHGAIDRDFWQCIYKPVESYGYSEATGWIMRFYPYLGDDDAPWRNAALPTTQAASGRARWITTGVSVRTAPGGFRRAPLSLHVGASTRDLSLYGGLVGVRRLENGVLRPEAAWAVGASPRLPRLLSRVLAAREEPSPCPPDDARARFARERPAELAALDERCDGALLFKRWNVLRSRDRHYVVGSTETGFLGLGPQACPTQTYFPSDEIVVIPICTLTDDPRWFGLYTIDGFPVVLCDPRRAQRPEELVVVADDVATFLERILDHEGAYWFEGLREPTLYSRLGEAHTYLRPALTPGAHPPPTDLLPRERYQLIFRLLRRTNSPEELAYWWEALRAASGTTKSFEHFFGEWRRGKKRWSMMDLMEALDGTKHR